MMASHRKRNIIPLNIVQKRGRKHHISKEFMNITVHSAVAAPQSPHISGSGSVNHGDGCIQDPMPEYLADQLEDQRECWIHLKVNIPNAKLSRAKNGERVSIQL